MYVQRGSRIFPQAEQEEEEYEKGNSFFLHCKQSAHMYRCLPWWPTQPPPEHTMLGLSQTEVCTVITPMVWKVRHWRPTLALLSFCDVEMGQK